MTFKARKQGFSACFQLKAERFSKAVSPAPLNSESCPNLSVCFHCTFIEIMKEKSYYYVYTFKLDFFYNRAEMSQSYRSWKWKRVWISLSQIAPFSQWGKLEKPKDLPSHMCHQEESRSKGSRWLMRALVLLLLFNYFYIMPSFIVSSYEFQSFFHH